MISFQQINQATKDLKRVRNYYETRHMRVDTLTAGKILNSLAMEDKNFLKDDENPDKAQAEVYKTDATDVYMVLIMSFDSYGDLDRIKSVRFVDLNNTTTKTVITYE